MERNHENEHFFRRLAIVSFILALSLFLFYGIYSLLKSPVTLPHDELAVVKHLYKEKSFAMSRQKLTGYYSSVPYGSFELLSTKEIVRCELHPDVYGWLSVDDTCVLRYVNGEYVYYHR